MAPANTVVPAVSILFGVLIGALAVWVRARSQSQLTEQRLAAGAEAHEKSFRERLAEKDAAVSAVREDLDQHRSAAAAEVARLQEDLRQAIEARARLEGEGVTCGTLQRHIDERDEEVARLRDEMSIANARLAEATTWAEAAVRAKEEALSAKDAFLERQLAEKERSLRAQLEEKQAAIDEQRELLAKAERKLSDTFDSLSVKALKTATDEFLKVAGSRFQAVQESAKGDLERREQAIAEMLKPIGDAVNKLAEHSQAIEEKRAVAYSGVTDQINRLMTETSQLSNAFRRPTVRGNWGEITLRTVADNAGLVEGQDYELQHSTDTEEGRLRADLVVKLPKGRVIAVDSKTPLDAYREAVNCEAEGDRDRLLREHAKAVRSHVRALSNKSYWQQYEGVDYVIMFLPAESIYQAALEHDPALMEDAVKARVLLANPMTLVGLLKAVAYLLDQERLNQNALEISDIGRKLYDGIRTFAGHMDKLGRHLRQSVDAYNGSVGSLERSVLSRARQLRSKGVSGGGAITDPESVVALPAPFRSAELTAMPALLIEAVAEAGPAGDAEGEPVLEAS